MDPSTMSLFFSIVSSVASNTYGSTIFLIPTIDAFETCGMIYQMTIRDNNFVAASRDGPQTSDLK